MKNFKLTIGFAATGFLISLIFGLFSSSGFIKVILFALLFGIIFAGLSVLIQFLYGKFLTIEGETDSGSVAGETNSVSGSSQSGVDSNHSVNIIIQDEELEQTGNSNHFDVGNNHQMLNESDMKAPLAAPVEKEPENQYVPIRNRETVSNFSGVEAQTPDENTEKRASQADQVMQEDDTLDVLPDMSELNIGGKPKSEDDYGFGGNNSEDATDSISGITSDINKSRNDNPGEIQDAAIMAKAISSILSSES